MLLFIASELLVWNWFHIVDGEWIENSVGKNGSTPLYSYGAATALNLMIADGVSPLVFVIMLLALQYEN